MASAIVRRGHDAVGNTDEVGNYRNAVSTRYANQGRLFAAEAREEEGKKTRRGG